MRMQNRQSEQSQKALAQTEGVDSDIQYVIAMDASCIYIYIYTRGGILALGQKRTTHFAE
jgi:hypothetical protein